MFGNTTGKRKFSYISTGSLKREKEMSLREKMKFNSFSSQEKKISKKKTMYLVILLLLIGAYILYFGFRNYSVKEIKINENEIENVNEQQ